MYIKSMVIDGFKSYGQRTEINGFDCEFNAITGLNGSGKSNILDAICFVLGITNLTQVRAGSLQELVYKSGQAGITKASVTITFDNRDTNKSPLGYERYEEITITRQAVVAGKNRYMINGSTVQNKRVNDLFNSVQLNVNNPHFLIMQGRITKVLNMKPPEILSMIEEAAGTRMYETKKQAAQKTIEKKDAKLKELSELINEEIGPKLTKLKEERNQYLELQKISREVEHLSKILVAWLYTNEEAKCKNAQETLEELNNNIKELQQKIAEGKHEEKDIESYIDVLRKKRDNECGSILADLERKLTEAEKLEAKISAKVKSNKDSINSEEKNIKRLERVVKDDESALADKQKELSKVENIFVQLKTADEEDSKALAEAQRKFQAVSAGLLTTDDGQEATLQEQLMSVKQEMSCAQSEAKQCSMQLEHNRTQLKNKQNEMKKTETEYVEDKRHLESMEEELARLQRELSRINYDEHKMENLKEHKRSLTADIRRLRETMEKFEAQHPALNFYYKDPEPNFNRGSVRGLVCSLFHVKDRKFAMALEMAAGGRLYNIVTDNELTSTKLIKNGQLRKRHTFIPLNKIQGYTMDNRTIQYAKDLVGENRVYPALSLIDFEKQYRPVMDWIFGQVFVCVDMQTAVEITYNQNILKKCITLDGDVTDPHGSLSGGAPLKSCSVLTGIAEYNSSKLQLENLEREYAAIDAEILALSKTADIYNNKKQILEIRQHEVETVRMRLQQSLHHQYQTEIEQLEMSLDTLTKELEKCKKREADSKKKVKELEEKVADAKNLRERELKAAEAEMNRLQKKSGESRKQWKEREGDFESLNLEIKDLKSSIETVQQDIQKCRDNVEQLKEEGKELATEVASAKTTVKELQVKVKEQKEVISKKNKEIQEAMHRKEVLLKELANSELQCTSLQHNVSKCQADAKESRSKLIDMEKSHDWILENRPYFGQPNGIYDFKATDPKEAGTRIAKLQDLKAKLSRTVNTRAMNILEKEEEQYNEMMKKKLIVIRDKEKIIAVIEELDKKKKEALRLAWEQVNKDFGSIFGSLLPGAQAKLKPPDGKDILDGLEVKVGFNGLWKDSLQELSGGQRSLVALSLILAMLLFKPAPIYILDEVDAALDLSHTQNIGQMLKAHFKHSQFIVVSLKDGMFNNANVLFRTKFVDGMSTVTRTTPGQK